MVAPKRPDPITITRTAYAADAHKTTKLRRMSMGGEPCSGDHTFCDPHIGIHFASAAALREALDSPAPLHHLTYALELAGNRLPADDVVPVLIRHLNHASDVVREGIIAGLNSHAERADVRAALWETVRRDSSGIVRSAAIDLLESTE